MASKTYTSFARDAAGQVVQKTESFTIIDTLVLNAAPIAPVVALAGTTRTIVFDVSGGLEPITFELRDENSNPVPLAPVAGNPRAFTFTV